MLAFFLVDKMLFPFMSTTLAQHFLVVPLTLFSMAVPLPFGALGFTEGVSDQLFKLVGHNGGLLAMMGFRVVLYSSGLVGACVYLAKLKEVRALTASARDLEHEMLEGELDEDREDTELGTPSPATDTTPTEGELDENREHTEWAQPTLPYERVGPGLDAVQIVADAAGHLLLAPSQ